MHFPPFLFSSHVPNLPSRFSFSSMEACPVSPVCGPLTIHLSFLLLLSLLPSSFLDQSCLSLSSEPPGSPFHLPAGPRASYPGRLGGVSVRPCPWGNSMGQLPGCRPCCPGCPGGQGAGPRGGGRSVWREGAPGPPAGRGKEWLAERPGTGRGQGEGPKEQILET